MSDRLAQLQKLHAADPEDAELTYMLAMEFGKAGRNDEAVRWFDRTLALDPGHHYAYYQKARSLAALEQHQEARRTIEEGIDRANADGAAKAAGELAGLLDSLAG